MDYIVGMKMSEKLDIKDKAKFKILYDDAIKTGVKGTKIIFKDHDTGEILHEEHNKVLITGGQCVACKLYGIDATVDFPNYNEEFGLENTHNYDLVQPMNEPILCLFCVGQGGCGTVPNDVFTVRYTERIEPKDMIPFRYCDDEHDINSDIRRQYHGRYRDEDGMIRYMFKSFDTEPQLHLRYLDGTEITEDMYAIDSTQQAECYVETRLRITRLDFRDYFDKVLGWGDANISTLSLLYAWYDATIDDYVWYQQILPFSKLNFPTEWLVDLTKSIDITYMTFF